MAYANDTYLAPEDFRNQFAQSWDDATDRFLKVERRQTYNQTGDPSYDAFIKGDYSDAANLLRKALTAQEPKYRSAQQRGVALVRLRLAELPLSDYLKYYEFPSYLVSRELGEQISVRSVQSEGRADDLLPDCIIFDMTVMYVNTYDGCGRPTGAIRVDDRNAIEEHTRLAEDLLADADPLDKFMAAHNL